METSRPHWPGCFTKEADGIGHVAGPFGLQISSSAAGLKPGICFVQVPNLCRSLALEFDPYYTYMIYDILYIYCIYIYMIYIYIYI